MRINWTNEKENYLLKLRRDNHTWKEITHLMRERFISVFTVESCRNKYRSLRDSGVINIKPKDEPKPYKEEIKMLQDGSHASDKLIELSEEEMKDKDAVLLAHGYNPDEWELTSSQSSMWHHHNKLDGTKTLFASKIKAKPKTVAFDTDRLLEIVTQTPRVTIKPRYVADKEKYLLLPLFDMHFGISDYEYYIDSQAAILEKLKEGYKEVLLIFGQDCFHNDDFRGRTASGTEIDRVDMVQAWEDASLFFEPIITEAMARDSKVSIVYSKGNHSETIEWAYVQYLKARYPQAHVDDSLKERKVHMLGSNFCGTNHGDKKNTKNLPENFATEFPIEWSKATTRTVFVGHKHFEEVIDVGGILVRRMPTKNKIDQYHDDRGYTLAHKRFQIHEFNEVEQLGSYYV